MSARLAACIQPPLDCAVQTRDPKPARLQSLTDEESALEQRLFCKTYRQNEKGQTKVRLAKRLVEPLSHSSSSSSCTVSLSLFVFRLYMFFYFLVFISVFSFAFLFLPPKLLGTWGTKKKGTWGVRHKSRIQPFDSNSKGYQKMKRNVKPERVLAGPISPDSTRIMKA